MPPLDSKELPSINPAIIAIDDANDMLDYVFDQSIGDYTPSVRRLHEHDILDYYYRACQIVGRERRLKTFVRTCGKICVDGVIDYDTPEYTEAQDFAIVERDIPTAISELDVVIRRFAPHATTFEALYGSVGARKVTPKSATKEIPPVELPEDRGLISRKKVSEVAQDIWLSPAAMVIARLASRKTGVKIAELATKRGIKSIYGPKPINRLRRALPGLVAEIIRVFEMNGVNAEWIQDGAGSATRYILAQIKSAEQIEAERVAATTQLRNTKASHAIKDSVEAIPVEVGAESLPKTPVRTKHARQPRTTSQPLEDTGDRLVYVGQTETPEQFASKLRATVESMVNGAPGGTLVIAVARHLETTYGASRTESRDAINVPLAAGTIAIVPSEEGRRLVPVSPQEKEAAVTAPEPMKSQPKIEALTEEGVAAAILILDHLAQVAGDVQPGDTIKGEFAKVLYRKLNLGVSEAEFRKIYRNLQDRRYLFKDHSVNQGKAPKGGGRPRKGTVLRIRGQDFKTRWTNPNNRQGYINRLKNPILE